MPWVVFLLILSCFGPRRGVSERQRAPRRRRHDHIARRPRELRAQRMQGGRHRRHLCEPVEVLRQQVPEQSPLSTGDVAVGRQTQTKMPVVPGIDQQLRHRLVLRLVLTQCRNQRFDSCPSDEVVAVFFFRI